MRRLALAGLLALGACGGPHVPKVVSVPVAVRCQTPKPLTPEYSTIQPDDGLFVRVQKLLANDRLRQGYITQLEAWGQGCNF